MEKIRRPGFLVSLSPIILLLVLIMLNVVGTDEDSLSGPNQLALFISAMYAAALSYCYGKRWNGIIESINGTFQSALPAIMILLMVGLISGSWTASGIIPSMIYYGLDFLHAEYFLPAVVIITAIVSLITGTSWGTIATVGIALIGVGRALGFSEAWVAGAIVSGAYFGDKISPLSDTTNLAAASAEVDVFDHIRFMLRTTTPTILLTIVIFAIMTFVGSRTSDASLAAEYQQSIESTFTISAWLLLIPVLVLVLIVKKVPAVLVLFIGSLIAIIIAFFVQQDYLMKLGDMSSPRSAYLLLTSILYGSVSPETGSEILDKLFSSTGMAGMVNTVWLIISAMIFAGCMEAGGFLKAITDIILKHVRNRFSTVGATTATCLLFNITAGDQYMAIMIPGRMYAPTYARSGFRRTLLSRTLEDSATVTSPIIPWNSCGATQASILQVSTLTYAPFAFFCWISPLMTLVFALFNTLRDSKALPQNKR